MSNEIKKLKLDIKRYQEKIDSQSYILILSPRFLPIVLMRLSFYFRDKKIKILSKFFSMINFILFGIEISSNCVIGEGVFFPHTVGTVIGAKTIGKNCVIYGGVTIGSVKLDLKNELPRPIIGDNVVMGSGSIILGNIIIGDNVKIEPNYLVKINIKSNTVLRHT
jgi:serine O-acetyltransferase